MRTETYEPHLMNVAQVRDETADVRSLRLTFADPALADSFAYRAGQFAFYSAFGEGESVFCIASSPTEPGYVECSFKLTGKVTSALRRLSEGDVMGFRGPYGNSFPIDEMVGHNLVFIGGGIGMAPVRSILVNCLDRRAEFGDITILNGARSAADLVYRDQTDAWMARSDVRCVKTVDPGGEGEGWDGEVGLIPHVLERLAPTPHNTKVVLCGPPIMIKFSLMSLEKMGFSGEQVITTLENRMKCGVGKCGRCNIGGAYVCCDGPVFTAAQIAALPQEF